MTIKKTTESHIKSGLCFILNIVLKLQLFSSNASLKFDPRTSPNNNTLILFVSK